MTAVAIAKLAGTIAIGSGLYVAGYWSGQQRGHDRAIVEATRYAADTCVVHTIATLKTATRMIEAKNRKPIILECAP